MAIELLNNTNQIRDTLYTHAYDRTHISDPMSSSSLYVSETTLNEYVQNNGIRLLVPRSYLFGIQRREEYSPYKRNIIEMALETQGIDFLFDHPIITCAVPGVNQDLLQIFTIDGHHRTRYSGNFGIRELPCVVLTPDQLVEAINSRKNDTNKPIIDSHTLTEQLREHAAETLDSFRVLADDKKPRYIANVHSIDELAFRLATFPNRMAA